MIRILTFDGGPSGPTYMRFLRAIEAERPGFLGAADALVGTSDGALMSLFMAKFSSEKRNLDAIDRCIRFSDDLFISTQPGCRGILRLITGCRAVFSLDDFYGTVKDYIGGDTRMSDLPTLVAAVSYEVRGNTKPKIFHNYPGDQDRELLAADVGLRSSALPMLVPVFQGFVDGGMYANNPAMVAVAQVLSQDATHQGVDSPHDLALCSFGGEDVSLGGPLVQRALEREDTDWGWIPWMLQPWAPLMVIDLLLNAGQRAVDFQAAQLIGNGYLRVAPELQAGTIDSLLDVIFNRAEEVIDAARLSAQNWVGRPDQRPDVRTPSFNETLAWVDRVWMNGDGAGG